MTYIETRWRDHIETDFLMGAGVGSLACFGWKLRKLVCLSTASLYKSCFVYVFKQNFKFLTERACPEGFCLNFGQLQLQVSGVTLDLRTAEELSQEEQEAVSKLSYASKQ